MAGVTGWVSVPGKALTGHGRKSFEDDLWGRDLMIAG